MGFLDSIFGALSSTTTELSADAIGQQLAALKQLLGNGQPENATVRLWVESGSSYGHQSSTVSVMYRIANADSGDGLNLGYAGTIEVYYGEQDDLPKLYALIPEMAGTPTHQVGNATVSLILRTAAPPATTVNFGLTGGAGEVTDYAAKLNVNYFVRLQPYNWKGAEEIAFKSGRATIDLTTVGAVGAGRFKRRLYYVEPSKYQTPPWDAWTNAPYLSDQQKQKLEMVRSLFSDGTLQSCQVQAAYSIKTGSLPFNQNTSFGAAVICAAAFEWQQRGDKPYKRAKPVVIVNFDEYGTPTESSEADLRAVLAGKLAADERGFAYNIESSRDAKDNYKRRKAYFEALNVGDRLHYLNYPQTLAEVQDAVTALAGKNNEVLFVQLGRSLPIAFTYALYRSSLPPLFEGQNTANNAVNIGRPYLQIPGTRATEEARLRIYPSVTLANYSSQQVPQALLRIASQISSSPMVWPTVATDAPPAIMGSFFQQYTDETPSNNTIAQYFAEISAFFASPSQDKLLLALAYLNSLLPTDSTALLAAAAAPNPLDALWDDIDAAVSQGGPVDLIPGIIAGGTIPTFVQGFLKDFSGGGLTLTVTTFEPATKPTTLDKITLAGSTDAFAKIGVKNSVAIELTAPDGALTASITFTADEQWSMPGAPWMAFDKPYIELTVPNNALPVAATIGGYYPALESSDPSIVAKLQIAIGGAAGRWPASLTFSPPNFPGIAKGYQLATGFNVVNSLPAPFNVVADLGISSIEVEYDYANSTVDSIAVVAQSNTPNLTIVGNLKLDDLTVTAIVLNPTTARRLTLGVSAAITLGTTVDPAVVTISLGYPELVLQGSLTSGTPTFTDLLATFVPDLEGVSLPHEPTLDKFDFMYKQSTSYLSLSTELVMPGWDFTFPLFQDPLFSLDTVAFSVTRDAGTNTGSITAHTTLLPKSQAPIGVDICGSYLANKDLQLVATTTTDVDIDTLVKEYLGDAWVPSGLNLPKLAGVGVTLVWGSTDGGPAGAKSFEFTAKTATPWEPIAALASDLSVTADLTLGYKPASTAPPRTPVALVATPTGTVIEARLVGDPAPAGAVEGGAYGKLAADVTLWFIHLAVEFDFDPKVKKVRITWTDVGLTATLETNDQQEQIATFTLDDQTVGSIVETFVGWATGTKFGLMAPFNVLDDISLSGLKITYNFTQKKVDFTVDIGPIDLGLFKISGITLAYNPNGNDDGKSNNKIEITINGSFAWEDGDSLSWEPDDPSTTPAPPGGGNKYFDLRLVALGQHVTVPGLVEETNVADVIEKLEVLDIPKPPEIPVGGPNQPTFAAASSWFVAFDFGILKVESKPDDSGKAAALESGTANVVATTGTEADDAPQYFISLAVVFNDPYLYALRLGLDGPLAKVFAGLDFQIMYQQVSKNVGRYSAQIALPTVMRTFQVGVASITLPTFAIEVYTNGDFQVDLGFPWNEDFTRSFSIEVQAGPFPVVGAAGFYFGKLSSATTDKVPTDTRPGWFNPVIVFGFGAQVGLGKSIEAGVLSAGFSVTVFGIIEGVIARWQPYNEITSGGDKNSLQDGYYFSLTGTFGLQGRVYGTINFAIISAELNVLISMYVRITFASYEPIPITAKASVSVTLTVKINLGLFKISIHLSFKAALEVTFVLANPVGDPSQAPWAPLAGPFTSMSGPQRLAARGLAKGASPDSTGLVTLTASLFATSTGAPPYTPTWSNLQPGTVLKINGWVAPVLTIAGDIATQPDEQQVCYVLNFFIDGGEPPVHTAGAASVGATADGAHVVAAREVARVALERARAASVASAGDDYSDTFDDLAIRVLLWVIAAGQQGAQTVDGIEDLVVTDDFLAGALSYLSGSTTPTPVGGADIEQFLKTQTQFLFALEQDGNAGGEPVSAVFFPAAPGLTLDVPAFGGAGPFNYTFGGYNSSSADYLTQLNDYFNELKVQVQAEEASRQAVSDAALDAAGDGPSIASYVFGDYFAMIGRLTIQAMRDGLRNFKLVVGDYAGQTAAQIVADINTTGDLGGEEIYTIGELFAANQKHPLDTVAGAGPSEQGVAISSMTWQAPGGTSFTDIAALTVFAGGVDATGLALANAASGTIIAPGIQITAPGGIYRTQSADSLATIAVALGYVDSAQQPDVAALLTAVPALLTSTVLLAPQSILAVPTFRHLVSAGDTLQTVASQYGVTLDSLAAANGDVTSLFVDDSDNLNLDVPHLPKYRVGQLIDEMKRTLALQHMGAMASRYYLHGLRLPTQFPSGGLTPKADGLFVTAGGAYPSDLGLFALTGQAFPLGDIPDPSTATPGDPAYAFTVSAGEETWLDLGTAGSTSVTFTLSSSDDYQRYSEVKAVAQSYLDTETSDVRPIDVAGVKPRRFPLSTEIPWQPAVDVTLPVQASAPSTPKPRLWVVPDELVNLPHGGVVRPTIVPVVARSDEATGTTVDEPVANYGFGTLVSFQIKKLEGAGASSAMSRTYEIIGAPESQVTLLERLLDQLTDDVSSFDQVSLFYRPSSTGSETNGWQSDDPASSLMGITQTNLSTETRPPTSLTAAATPAAMAVLPQPNLIGTPNEFLRLLWEASITRQGGFYLGYTTGIGGSQLNGLPDHAFNDRNEAEVAVLAVFTTGSDTGQALGSYMNVAVTNEPFDLSHAALVAETVPVSVTAPRPFEETDSLASYAATYYTGAGVLAMQNAAVAFQAGRSLTVAGGLYQVPPNPTASPNAQDPGADLAQIAAHFATTPEAIRAVNAGQLPDTLQPLTALVLPTLTVASDGQSMQKLADFYGVPVAEVAAANFDVAGLFPAAPLTVTTGPASLAPTVPRGVAGMQLQRVAPDVPDTPGGDWGTEYIRQNFSLLGYRVAANNGNDYFPQSAWGLPSGPVDPDAVAGGDKIQAPTAPAVGDPWDFSFSVPFASVLAGDGATSPYAGIGGILQFELAWLDIFGNRILSELDNPSPPEGRAQQRQPQLTGYTDLLVGIGQWPAVANAYQVVPDGTSKAPTLVLELDFDATAYQAAAAAIAGSDPSAAQSGKNKIAQGIAAYTLITQQLDDPSGVDIELATSVTPSSTWTLPVEDPPDPQPGQPASLKAWAATILSYLQLLAGDPTAPPPAAYRSQLALDVAAINAGQIFKLETTVTVRRRQLLVAGALAPVTGVAAAATAIAPFTGPLSGDVNAQSPRTLTAFATDFTAAFASIDGIELRIATGADRAEFTGSGNSTIWVVQLGTAGAEPISFSITDAGNPTVYAPRPISNALVSKAATPIIRYTTGSVIQIDGPYDDRSFTSIDLDKWMATTLGFVDELFTPRFTSAADILRHNIAKVPNGDKAWPDALGLLVEAKKNLARNLRSVMIAVYDGENPGAEQVGDIQEAFYQTMLAMMSGFYGVKVGVQFTAEVNAAIRPQPDATSAPRVFGDVLSKPAAVGNGGPSAPATAAAPTDATRLSISSPKLELRFAGASSDTDPPPSYLSSLVSGAAIEAKNVSLDLEFQGQYIEHEIGHLVGIDGYEPSSWLSFVDIGSDSGGRRAAMPADLGTFAVPIVVREFPVSPTLVNQDQLAQPTSPCYQPTTDETPPPATMLAATSCSRTGTYNPVAATTSWTYAFTYSLQIHRQQDEIHVGISFNIAEGSKLMSDAVAERDVFDNLAQFTQVYPQVRADLNQYLVPLDVDTTDETTLKNAQAALESVAAMIDWLGSSPPQLGTSDRVEATAGATTLSFTIAEGTSEIDGVEALTVTVTSAAALPPRVGEPFVTIAGYDCELRPDSSEMVRTFAYKSVADGSYLPASTGMSIAPRTFVLPDLDVLERQDAQTQLRITRNADLVPGKTIAQPFIYTTPTVSFEESLHPTLVVGSSINLATIFSTGANDPVKRSLDCQLGLLYEALFANAGTDDVTMQLGVYYEYEINSAIAPIRLPVFLMPPTRTKLGEDGQGTPLADVVATQVQGLTGWFRSNSPSTAGGSVVLDLTVMSDLTTRPMPILHLTGLYVPYDDLDMT